jgi:hypothetical protein
MYRRRILALVALLTMAGTAWRASASAPAVTIDRERLRAEVAIARPEGEVIVSLDPLMNLLLHTMNVYDLLGLHGRGYALRDDPGVRQVVDPKILANIAGTENYFAGGGRDFYSPTMSTIMEERISARYPDRELLLRIAPEPLNDSLVRMWEGFYRGYWSGRFETLVSQFIAMNESVQWGEALDLMERWAGRPWRGTMYVFAVEGTADSAVTYGDDVCIGTVRPGDDAGFVHEGLHLLLKENWAKSPRLQQFMAGRTFQDSYWGRDWPAKYEQALVVALEWQAKRRLHPGTFDLARVQRAFKGCGVGDLFEIAWPLTTRYADQGGMTLDDLMWELVHKGEAQAGRSGPGPS